MRTLYFGPESQGNYFQSLKSLGMSVEMLPHFISHLLGNYIQFVKPLHVSEKKKHQEFSYASPRVTDKDLGSKTSFVEIQLPTPVVPA